MIWGASSMSTSVTLMATHGSCRKYPPRSHAIRFLSASRLRLCCAAHGDDEAPAIGEARPQVVHRGTKGGEIAVELSIVEGAEVDVRADVIARVQPLDRRCRTGWSDQDRAG